MPILAFQFKDLFSTDYRLIVLLLIVLPLLVYWQVYDFAFVWDDGGVKYGGEHLFNPFVKYPSWQSFTQLFSEPFFRMYIPISYLFWGLLKFSAELFSLPVNSALHLTNVVVHIINGLLVFTLLQQFVVNKWAVAIGVGFFLLHPIQVEAVAWVSEFRGLLATLFVLLAWYYYLKIQSKPSTRFDIKIFSISYLSLVFFILAVLSKPSAVVLVPFVFLINHFYYGLTLKRNIQKTLPYILIAIITVVIAYWAQLGDIDFTKHTIAYWQRPIAWLDSIVFYLYKILYPYHLSASYTLSPKYISTQWWFYPLALLPLALGYLLWLKRNSQPLIIFAVLLFIAGFFTTSGFLDFGFQRYSLVADRYVYLSMVGVAMFIAVVFSKTNKQIWQGLIVFVLLIFASLSVFRQVPIWQDELRLWSHGAHYEIEPSYGHENLGITLYNQGLSLLKLKQHRQAISYFDKAIKTYPKYFTKELSKAFGNKAIALSNLGKHKQALIYSDKAIKYFPKNDTIELSKVFYLKGVSFFQQKKYQYALENFNQALKINPSYADAYNASIHVLTLLNQCQQAKEAIAFAKQHKIKLQSAILQNLQKQCPN